MEPMSKDWGERLAKARTNEEFIYLLNEILLLNNTSMTPDKARESSTGGPLMPLNSATVTQPRDTEVGA